MSTLEGKIRKETIDGFPVYVIDNFIDLHEAESFFHKVSKLPFRRTEKDNAESEFPIFGHDFDPLMFAEEFVIGRQANNILREIFPDKKYTLFRSYINMSHFGDVDFPHRDCEKGSGNITVLYYVNTSWDYTWGGETKFYEDGDPKILIMPKVGRCAVFFGEVEHSGSIPSRICKYSRLTLALKYFPED